MHWLAAISCGGEDDETITCCSLRRDSQENITTGTQRGSLVAWRRGSCGAAAAAAADDDRALSRASVRRRVGAPVVRLLAGPARTTLALHADGTLTLWADDTCACSASRAIFPPPPSSSSRPLLVARSFDADDDCGRRGVVVVVAAAAQAQAPLSAKAAQQQQGGASREVPSQRPPAPPTARCFDWRTLEEQAEVTGARGEEGRPPLAAAAAGAAAARRAGGGGPLLAPLQQLARVAGMPAPGGGDRALAATVVGAELQVVMASGWVFGAPITSAEGRGAEEDEEDVTAAAAPPAPPPRASAPLSSASFSHDGSLLLTVSRGAWQVYRRARRRDSRWTAVVAAVEEEEELVGAASPFKAVRFQEEERQQQQGSAPAAAAAAAQAPVSSTPRHYVGGAVLRHSAAGAEVVLWDASGAADWVRCAFDDNSNIGRSTAGLLQRLSIDLVDVEPIVDFASVDPGVIALATRRRVWLITVGSEGVAAEGPAIAVRQGGWSIDRSIDRSTMAEELSIVDRLSTAATTTTTTMEGGALDDGDDDSCGAYAMAVGCNLWAPPAAWSDDGDGCGDGGAATAAAAAAAAPVPKAAAGASTTSAAAPPLSPMYLGARRVAFFPPTGGVAIAGLAACCLPGASIDRFSSSAFKTTSSSLLPPPNARDAGSVVVTCALQSPNGTLLLGGADGSVRAWALSTSIDLVEADAADRDSILGAWHLHSAPVRRILLPPLDSPAPWNACIMTAADDGTLAVFSVDVDRQQQQQQKSNDCRFFSGFPYGCPSHVAWHPASGVVVAGAVVGASKELCVWAWDLGGGLDRVLRGDEARRLLGRLGCLPQQQQESRSADRSADRSISADPFATVAPPYGTGGGVLIDVDVSAALRRAAHQNDRGAVADAASALAVLHLWGADPVGDSEVVLLLLGLGLITAADALRARKASGGALGGLVQVARAGGLGGFAVGSTSFSAPRHLSRLVALVALADVLRGPATRCDLGKLVDFCAVHVGRLTMDRLSTDRLSADRSIVDRLSLSDESIDRPTDLRLLLASLTVHPTGPLRRAARWLLGRVADSPAGRSILLADRSDAREGTPSPSIDVDWLCTLLLASAAPRLSAASTASLLALVSTPSLAGALAAQQLDRLLLSSSCPSPSPSFSRVDLFTRLSAVFEKGLHASRGDPQELGLLVLQQQQQHQHQQHQHHHRGPTTSALFRALGPLDLSAAAPVSVSVAMLRELEQDRLEARASAEDELLRQPADAAWVDAAMDLAGTLCASSADFAACLQVAAASLSSDATATGAFLVGAVSRGVAALVKDEEEGLPILLPQLGMLGAIAVQAVDQTRPTLRSMCSLAVASIVSSIATLPQAAVAGGVLLLGSAAPRLPAAPASSSSSFMLPAAVALPLSAGGTRRVVCLLPLATTAATTTATTVAVAAAAAATATTTGAAASAPAFAGSSRALLPPRPPSAAVSHTRVSDAELGMSGLDRWWGSANPAGAATSTAAATAGATPSSQAASTGASTDSLLKLDRAPSGGLQATAAEEARAAEALGLRLLHAGRAFYPSRPARCEPLFAAAAVGVTAVALRACSDGHFFAAAWLAELDAVVVWRLSAATFGGGGGGDTLLPHGYLPLPRATVAGELPSKSGDVSLAWASDEMLELRHRQHQPAATTTLLWSSAVWADPLGAGK